MELPRPSDGIVTNRKVTRNFFQRDPVVCARELIGCTFEFGSCSGIIVETEAYAAEGDPACHTWRRKSARDFISRHEAGTAYVYLNYGMHWLCNFLIKGGTHDGFVLIRALEPLAGIELMRLRRKRTSLMELCNGPGKLTQACGITGLYHESDPISEEKWHLSFPISTPEILVSTRIGITQAADFPWRFLLKGNNFMSIPA